MREIKFRAWVKSENCYMGKWSSTQHPTIFSAVNEVAEFYGDDDLVIEQFTGLLDRNGKEIYEGDIVKTTDRVTVKGLIFPIGVVEFKQQAFWICNVPSERPDFTHNETLLKYWETDLEVIGNVHEDKGLLND